MAENWGIFFLPRDDIRKRGTSGRRLVYVRHLMYCIQTANDVKLFLDPSF